MAVKAIFFDIDGTIFSHTSVSVPQSTIEAFKKLQRQHILCIASTGRHITELAKLHLQEYINFDAYVTLNGQYCYNDHELIYDLPLAKEDVCLVYNDAKKRNYPVIFVTKDDLYINMVNDDVRRIQNDIHSEVPRVKEPDLSETIYQLIPYIAKSDFLSLPHCQFQSWHEDAFDVMPKEGGKDNGIRQVMDYYHLQREEIMAFGDGENDISMIEMAKTGIAMGNADDKVKQAADYVTDSIDQDGIDHALRHFKIIE